MLIMGEVPVFKYGRKSTNLVPVFSDRRRPQCSLNLTADSASDENLAGC